VARNFKPFRRKRIPSAFKIKYLEMCLINLNQLGQSICASTQTQKKNELMQFLNVSYCSQFYEFEEEYIPKIVIKKFKIL
jgi:hypothetical protein